jgi:hypothetical protein
VSRFYKTSVYFFFGLHSKETYNIPERTSSSTKYNNSYFFFFTTVSAPESESNPDPDPDQDLPPISDKIQCCGSEMFIPDPGSEFFPSRIPDPNFFLTASASKNLSIFNPKHCF